MKQKQKKVEQKDPRKPAFQDDIINSEFVLMQRIVALENALNELREKIGKNGEVHNHYHYHYPQDQTITNPTYPNYPNYPPYVGPTPPTICDSRSTNISSDTSGVHFTGKVTNMDVEGT